MSSKCKEIMELSWHKILQMVDVVYIASFSMLALLGYFIMHNLAWNSQTLRHPRMWIR